MSVRQTIGAVLGIGAIIAAAALILVVAYFSVGPSQIDVARRAFPSGVELGESLHQENVSGLLEGCGLVIFRLSDESARSLQADAASYLHRLGHLTGRGQTLSSWRETPVTNHERVNASVAWACSNRLHPLARRPHAATGRPGSYYTTFAHGEGILVLIPSERAAVFLYFG